MYDFGINGMGHQHKDTNVGLHFFNPVGGGRATRFDADVRFPMPQGESWELMLADHKHRN
jgi:hypothetical protein